MSVPQLTRSAAGAAGWETKGDGVGLDHVKLGRMNGPEFMEPLLRARDVAVMLGVGMDTVLDHFQAGELPGFRLYGRKGGPVRFRRSDILETLESWRVGTVPGPSNGPAAPKRPGPVLKEVSP